MGSYMNGLAKHGNELGKKYEKAALFTNLDWILWMVVSPNPITPNMVIVLILWKNKKENIPKPKWVYSNNANKIGQSPRPFNP